MLTYTVLRNVLDNLILASASLQKFADFYHVEGMERGKPLDIKSMKKLRKKTEYEVRLKVTGKLSELTQETRNELEKWDMMFDWEVHGAPFLAGWSPRMVERNRTAPGRTSICGKRVCDVYESVLRDRLDDTQAYS